MESKINFFDAAEANKRNSLILLFLMFIIYLGMIFFFSDMLELGLFGVIIGVLVLVIYMGISYYQGDKIILSMSGAREIKEGEYPFIQNVVEGLALSCQIPKPKIYIIEDSAPNAFATGNNPNKASIAITRGLLESMKKEEIEGVIAHEISHIANYDIRFSMIAIVFAGAIAFLADLVWRGVRWSGGSSRKKNDVSAILFLIGLVFIILAPIFAELVRFAISRQREYLADANGARLTRYPSGLASALKKIKEFNQPTNSANKNTAPLYFSNPFPMGFGSLFATHPPIEERIKRLESM